MCQKHEGHRDGKWCQLVPTYLTISVCTLKVLVFTMHTVLARIDGSGRWSGMVGGGDGDRLCWWL